MRAWLVVVALVAAAASASNITQWLYSSPLCSGKPTSALTAPAGTCSRGGIVQTCESPALDRLCITVLGYASERDCVNGGETIQSGAYFCDTCVPHRSATGELKHEMTIGCNTSAPTVLSNCTDSSCDPKSCATRTTITHQCTPVKFSSDYISRSVARCGAVRNVMYESLQCTGTVLQNTTSPSGVCLNGGKFLPCQ